MGVAGLWDVIRPAGTVRSLTHLAVKDGFEVNPDGKRGFRLGIDASIWFFHAEYGREGENPVLRTLFFRCATLMRTTFLPLFVFDGPRRPDVKRGKKINRTSHKLIPGMKQIVEAFGFEWWMAPGEAEAELAYLNSVGIIDGILSDDVDNFLFGARTVIRNSSNTLSGNRANPILNSAGKDDKNHTRVFYINEITNHPDIQLTRGGMILIGIMSGGDYQQGGLTRCGVTTAHALARCGFGDSLLDAATNLDQEALENFLDTWREDVRDELRTNSKGEIGRKHVALANSITSAFPDINVLLSYVKPITSESLGQASKNLRISWGREPDLAQLAGVCEFYFEWGYREAIVKRFRTVMWHSIVLRILRRAVLDLDQTRSKADLLTTPKKKNRNPGKALCGTPSKLITKHFSSLNINSPAKVYTSESDEEDEEQRLIVKVHGRREHPFTDGLSEYRLEIAPKQLVQLTESGITDLRTPEGPDEWASEEVEDDEDGGKKRKKAPIDPEAHLRVWMPASMVKLVEPRLVDDYEGLQERKKAKKGERSGASKAKTSGKKKKDVVSTNADITDVFSAQPTKSSIKKSGTTKPSLPFPRHGIESSSESENLPESILPKKSPKEQLRRRSLLDEELCNYDYPRGLWKVPESPTTNGSRTVSKLHVNGSAPLRTGGVRDLTKNKKNPSTTTMKGEIKSFFTVTQSSSSSSLMKKLPAQISRISPSDGDSARISSRSPSKRNLRERASSVESSHSDSLGASPSKRIADRAARARVNSPSPAPQRKKKVTKVIEISSESEQEEVLPPISHPLLRARARAKASQNLATIKANVVSNGIDIIDLT